MSFTDAIRNEMEIEPGENRTVFAMRYARHRLIGEVPLGQWSGQIIVGASGLDQASPEGIMFRQTLQGLPNARFEAANALKLIRINDALADREAIVGKLAQGFHEQQEALVVLREKLPHEVEGLIDIDPKELAEHYMSDLEAGAALFDKRQNQLSGPGV